MANSHDTRIHNAVNAFEEANATWSGFSRA